MKEYSIQVNTINGKLIDLGKVNAENGWHAIAVAKKIAAKKGIVVLGANSCVRV